MARFNNEKPSIVESDINFISEKTEIEGTISLDAIAKVYGTIKGEIRAKKGSIITLCETSMVEGNIFADTIIIEGFVRGEISASTKVVLSNSARVIGNIHTPCLKLEFGAYFEGRALTSGQQSQSV
ncbi:MAG: polymer-forming cytoskeletal protein [Bdellovibrionota bacterium]